jgi:hypothetical protein
MINIMEQPLSFTSRIRTTGGFSFDFHFHRIFTVNGLRYHVTVVREGELFHFSVTENGKGWKIIGAPQPPQWILDIENRIEEVLMQME